MYNVCAVYFFLFYINFAFVCRPLILYADKSTDSITFLTLNVYFIFFFFTDSYSSLSNDTMPSLSSLYTFKCHCEPTEECTFIDHCETTSKVRELLYTQNYGFFP